MLNFRLARPSALVDLGGIEELAGIRGEDGALVVGAMTRQWDLEHAARRLPAPPRRPRVRRPHGDALPRHGRRLARPRRPDRRAARVRARARRGAGARAQGARSRPRSSSSPSSRPRSSPASCSSRPGSRRRRARPPFVELAHRARRLRGRLRRAERRPGRRRRRRRDAGALGRRRLDPVGDLFAPAGYKREVAASADRRLRVIEIAVTVNGLAYERRGRAAPAPVRLPPPRARALRARTSAASTASAARARCCSTAGRRARA